MSDDVVGVGVESALMMILLAWQPVGWISSLSALERRTARQNSGKKVFLEQISCKIGAFCSFSILPKSRDYSIANPGIWD